MTGADHLFQAADQLRKAISSDKPLIPTAKALRSIILAMTSQDTVDPTDVSEVSRLLFAVAPNLAAATAGRLAPEHVYQALGYSTAALTCIETPRCFELLAFVALLEFELRTLALRDALISGTQMDLAIAVARNPFTAASFETGPSQTH